MSPSNALVWIDGGTCLRLPGRFDRADRSLNANVSAGMSPAIMRDNGEVHQIRAVTLTGEYPPAVGGVAGFAGQWVKHVEELGGVVVGRIITGRLVGYAPRKPLINRVDSWSSPRQLRLAYRAMIRTLPECVVFHYVPHMYSRRGVPLGVVLLLLSIRVTRPHIRIVSLLHEIAVTPESVPTRLISLAQWVLASLIGVASHAVVVTTPNRRLAVARRLPWLRPKLLFIPISASVDLLAAPSPSGRKLTLLHVGSSHPSTHTGWVEACATRVLEAFPLADFVVTGPAVGVTGVTNLGRVPDQELARLIASADVVLQPFRDGASTRRTTIVNALAAGRPVVSSLGSDTGPEYFDGCLLLAESSDEFVQMVEGLCADEAERSRMAEAARVWSNQHVSWDVTAVQWTELLTELSRPRRRNGVRR